MTILQLNPPLPVYIEEKGTGLAHAMIDYSIEHHIHWVVFLDSDGSCWTVPNPKIKMQFNQTLGRLSPFKC